jgi:hypothetical protein
MSGIRSAQHVAMVHHPDFVSMLGLTRRFTAFESVASSGRTKESNQLFSSQRKLPQIAIGNLLILSIIHQS